MKRSIALALASLLALSAWAQVAHDPNDQVYDDLDLWATRGYVSMLPPVRPYPVKLLEELLGKVVRKGDASARAAAQKYLDALSPEARPMHVGVVGAFRGQDDDLTLDGAPTVDGTLRLEEWLTATFRMDLYGVTRKPGDEIVVPGADSPYPDLVIDNAKVGPFYVLGDWTSMVSAGSSSAYFQAGLSRSSFGPLFDESVVVGPQAGRAGHFDLVYRKSWWSYSGMLLALSATNDYGSIADNSDIHPNKYVALHSLDFAVTDSLELGYFESVVWGNRFETMYLAPFTNFMANQSLAGFDDNCFMGFHFRWSAFKDFQALGQIYIDDLSFNDLARLNFDTKYKFASDVGIRWAPEQGLISDSALSYTAVMPYMYTHVNGDRANRYTDDAVNYYNYTHLGRGLGSDLQPNSDRVSARISFRLIPNLDLSLSGSFQRHGNASEDGDGDDGTQYAAGNSGTIYDDGYEQYDKDGETSARNTFNDKTRFLTQDVIEMKASAGVGVAFTLPTPIGKFKAGVDYVYEYAWNRNLVEDKDGAAHYYVFSGTWRW